jgi:hypothetical protein
MQDKVEIILRPTVSRPVAHGVRPQWGPVTNSFFPLDSCGLFYFVAPSLTRGRVCNLMLLLGLAQSLSSLSQVGLMIIIHCPNFVDSPNLEAQVPLFTSPRDQVAQLYPRALGSLSVALWLAGLLSRHSNPPPLELGKTQVPTFLLQEMVHIESDASNTSSAVANVFVATVTSLPDRSLATIVEIAYRHTVWWEELPFFFFVIPFYLQSALVHSANCVKKKGYNGK